MRAAWPLLALAFVAAPLSAQTPDAEFFESKIRPVLATRCFGCHSSKLAAPKGDLVLDTKAGLTKGGRLGPEIVPGKPAESRLLHALSHTDPALAMPPTGKLSDQVIADFEQWIAKGAVDPRVDPVQGAPAPGPLAGMPIEQGRKWWAFAPVVAQAPRRSGEAAKAGHIDAFINSALAAKKLTMSPRADRRTLVTRAYVDLV